MRKLFSLYQQVFKNSIWDMIFKKIAERVIKNTFTAIKLLIIDAKSVSTSDFSHLTYIWGGGGPGFCRLPWFGLPHECGVGGTFWRSKASAGLHHHVSVLLENHVVVIVIEEHRNGAELGGSAACLRNLVGLQEVDLPKQHDFMLIVQF